MKKLMKPYYIHLICWIIFILYESLSIGFAVGAFGEISNYIVYYSLNIGLFYFHSLIILPAALQNGNQWIWRLPFLVAAEIILYLLLLSCIDTLLINHVKAMEIEGIFFETNRIFSGLWRSTYFIIFASGYYALKRYLAIKLREKDVAIELESARNAFLKAQINPHLLFNTLSYIYSTAYKTEPEAARAILLLSKIMRYAVETEHAQAAGTLAEEIAQAENFIELNKIRKANEVYISFRYSEATKKIKFIPLILLTLTENVFKHGNLSKQEDPAIISIEMDAKYLIIKTDNLINTGLNSSGFKKGLKNIEQRLQMHYHYKATLRIREENNHFKVEVAVPLESLE